MVADGNKISTMVRRQVEAAIQAMYECVRARSDLPGARGAATRRDVLKGRRYRHSDGTPRRVSGAVANDPGEKLVKKTGRFGRVDGLASHCSTCVRSFSAIVSSETFCTRTSSSSSSCSPAK